ncbi:unnamed protein product [Cladocopium goreaui]|uniref:Uncharacterized protein n=1 Tax=Cladocopium goreaui TaxID=2562237 RepID=A0A9P1C245_9DINO|nr:unnamed protein product [Cladocopium goreaui]
MQRVTNSLQAFLHAWSMVFIFTSTLLGAKKEPRGIFPMFVDWLDKTSCMWCGLLQCRDLLGLGLDHASTGYPGQLVAVEAVQRSRCKGSAQPKSDLRRAAR